MANCHTDGGRKHTSAMDMYVGALHSKLYSPNRDVHGNSYGSKYNAASKDLDQISKQSSDSLWKEPASHGRASLYGSFREDTRKPAASCGVDLCHSAKPLLRKSPTPVADSKKEPSSDPSPGFADKSCFDVQKTAIDAAPAIHNPNTAQDCASAAGADATKLSNGVNRCASFTDRVVDRNRSHKSAEFSSNGVLPSGNKLTKSGEHFTTRTSVNARNLRDGSVSGHFYPSNVPFEGYGFPESLLSTVGGSPTGTKDGRRWPSFGSQGSTDSMGGSPTAKDSCRRSSFSNGGSSDGGSPMAKDMWRRSSNGGYGSSDSSSSSVGSPTTADGTRKISSSVLNDKDVSSSANLRGMGNIFGGGIVKNSSTKPGANDSSKSADALARRLDSVVQLNKKECSQQVKGCLGGTFNGNLGNICPTNSTGSVISPCSKQKGSEGSFNSNLGNICPTNGTGLVVSPCPKQKGSEDNGTPYELSDPEDIKSAGNEKYRLGHFLEAIALYDKCIALCPDHAAYRGNKAAALAGVGKLVEAVQECEDAIRLDSKYSRAHHRAAQLYLRLGLIESARRRFRSAGLQDDARDVISLQAVEKHVSKCIEARKLGDWKGVLRESMAAITAGADSAPQILGYKSEALLKLNRPEEAEAVCTEAEKLEQSVCKQGLALADSFLSILRAHIEISLGRFDTAITAAQVAAKIDPRSQEVASLLRKARLIGRARISGNEHFNAGKFFEACAAYGEGLESDPTNAVLLCNRAACRSKLGQWEKALEDCDAALKSQPQYIKALMRRAHCSLKLERWEDALRDYEFLRVKVPSNEEVSRGLFEAQVAIEKAKGEEIHQMRFGREVEDVLDIGRFKDLVDVDGSPEVALAEAVSNIPTLRIFRNGHKVKELLSPSQQDLEFAVRQYS